MVTELFTVQILLLKFTSLANLSSRKLYIPAGMYRNYCPYERPILVQIVVWSTRKKIANESIKYPEHSYLAHEYQSIVMVKISYNDSAVLRYDMVQILTRILQQAFGGIYLNILVGKRRKEPVVCLQN